MMTDTAAKVNECFEVVRIRECARCGDTGNEKQDYAVDGIARIAGNLCVGCVRELDDRFSGKRAVTDGGRDQSTTGVDR